MKRLPRLADVPVRCHVFVAIDRATCWVHMGVGRDNSAETAAKVVERLQRAAPFKVAAVVVGKRAAFSARPGRFDTLCRSLGVEPRVAGRETLHPHLRIEQFNLRLRPVLEQLRHKPFAVAAQTLQRYAWLHNQCRPQAAPHPATPSEALQHWRASHPRLFSKGSARAALSVVWHRSWLH